MALAASAFALGAVLGCTGAAVYGSGPALAVGLVDAVAALVTFAVGMLP